MKKKTVVSTVCSSQKVGMPNLQWISHELQILCIRFCEYVMGIVSKVMTFFNAYALSHDQIISYVKVKFEYG